MNQTETKFGIIFLITTGVIFSLACEQASNKSSEEIPSLFSQPITVPINLDSGYRINPFTGDSIHPLVNSLGDTIVTGRFNRMKGKETDAGLYSTVSSSPGPQNVVTKPQSTFPVQPSLTSIEVEEKNFKRIGPAPAKQQRFILNTTGDSVPTGIPLLIRGKSIICKQPQPTVACGRAGRSAAKIPPMTKSL